jgi:hypothetical protein
MKSITTFICLMLFALCGFSQYVELSEDTVQIQKNSVGVVINPIVAMALGAGTSELHYGVTYKRVVAQNKRLRFAGLYQSYKENDNLGSPVFASDSNIIFNSIQNSYQYGEFRMGMEWSDFREKHDGIYGLDVLVGYDKRSDTEHLRVMEHNTAPADGEHAYYMASDTIVNNRVEHSLAIGIAPVIGYRVLMKQHWELMATCSPEIVYYSALKTEGRSTPGAESLSSTLLFRLRLLDLVFSYNF